MHAIKRTKLPGEATAAVETSKSAAAVDDGPDPSLVWTADILQHITAHLTANEVVCLRLVSKAAAELFKNNATFRLSQPAPPEAFEQRWAQTGSCRSLSRAQREKLVSLVAGSGVVANLQIALEATGLAPRPDDLHAAARAGDLATCKFLSTWLPSHLNNVFQTAAYAGQRVVCEWILDEDRQSMRPGARIEVWMGAKHAAEGGQLAILEWLLEEEEKLNGGYKYKHSMFGFNELMYAAWQGLDLQSARQLHRQLCARAGQAEGEGLDLCNTLAAALNDPSPQWRSKAEWLLEQGAEVPQHEEEHDGEGGWYKAFPYRAFYGRFPGEAICERFEWLKSMGHPVSENCGGMPLDCAIKCGCTAAVAWLLEHGATPAAADMNTHDLLPDQLAEQHLGVLQALKAAGCLELDDFVDQAAAGGAMAILQWAWEEWDWDAEGLLTPELFTSGAKSGSVEAMRWLLQRGCPMSEEAWAAAAESGCEAAVELLAELGCPMPAGGEPYMAAIGEPIMRRGREWLILPVLRKAGVPFAPVAVDRDVFTRAVRRGAPVKTLEWLLAEGCCVDWAEAEAAVERNCDFFDPSLDPKANVLAWLRQQRCRTRRSGRGSRRQRAK